MRIKFFTLLGSILYSIYRAEDDSTPKDCEEKRKRVMKEVHLKAVRQGILASLTAKFRPEIINLIIDLIDTIVALLNALGIFEHAERAVRRSRGEKIG